MTGRRGYKALIGDKAFYKTFVLIAIPIIIQQLVINSATIIDSFMVGDLVGGATAMGVVMPIVFIPTFIMFATSHGSGVHISQFYGAGDKKNLNNAFGVKLKAMMTMAIVSAVVIFFGAEQFARLYTSTESVIKDASEYLRIYAIQLIPLFLGYAIASTFTQVGKPKATLWVSIVGTIINIVLNYLFIFELKLGVVGAAYGTLISKSATCLIYLLLLDKSSFTFGIRDALKAKSPQLAKVMILVTIPLLLNELIWAFGMSARALAWSRYGDNVVGALAIQSNVQQIINVVFAGMSAATAYIVGTTLGKGDKEKAKAVAFNLIGASIIFGLLAGTILFIIKEPLVGLYNVNDLTRRLAIDSLSISSFYFVTWVVTATMFFILRSGGKTKQLFIMDGLTIWLFVVPTAFILQATGATFLTSLIVVYGWDVFKMVLALVFILQYKWINVLTNREPVEGQDSDPTHC